MSDLNDKVAISIERIRRFANFADNFPPNSRRGYYLAFSGGKDSVAVKRLMDMAGVRYETHYRITSVDPPELVRFIRENYPDVIMDRPTDKHGPVTMWNLIPRKLMPPTRLARYCCKYLKEPGGNDRFVVTGVRWAEGVDRKRDHGIVTTRSDIPESENFKKSEKGAIILVNDNDDARREIEACTTLHKMLLNPIVDWSDLDVWDFIHSENIPYCSLYDEGFHRIGCIGCPMARQHGRERQFARWPKYQKAYLDAFQKMLDVRERRGLMKGSWAERTTPSDVFRWWMEYDVLPGQIDLFEEGDES